MTEIRQRIKEEAEEVERECGLRAKEHFLAAGKWNRFNLLLGIPATVLAGITSVAALSNLAGANKDVVAGVLAIMVAALTALTTFLNPGEKANAHKAASSSYDALKVKASFLKDVDLSIDYASLDDNTKEVIKQLKEITSHLTDLGQNSPQIPLSIYKKQRREVPGSARAMGAAQSSAPR